jgi:acyl-CoA synthetase (NDP forming)
MNNLAPFFKPRTIAIVGASNNPQAISGKPIPYLNKHGFQGEIYPVNPKYEKVQGITCYPNLASIPEVPDVAMLVVKAERIFDVVKDCKAKGITHIIIVSSGFAESGSEGAVKQEKLVSYAKESGISMIGPNSQGVVSLVDRTALSFSASLERDSLILGDVGFISQSGAFGNSVFSLAQDENIGFAYIACTGNEAGVNTFDLMEWMLKNEKVRVVACYNEGFQSADKFKFLSELSKEKKKPIVWFKSGKTEAGQKAAGSHTGALAGEDAVFDRLIRQYGMLRVNDISELFDTVEVFRGGRFSRGKRVGILSTSGGTGVMLADEFIESGFEVPELPKNVQSELAQVLPSFANTMNPIDVTAQVLARPDMFRLAGEILARHEAVDVICISLTMVVGEVAEKVTDAIIQLQKITNIPVVVSWTINRKRNEAATVKLKENRIPLLQTPVRAAYAAAQLINYSQFLNQSEEAAEVNKSTGEVPDDLFQYEHMTEYTVKQELEKSGLPVTKEVLVQSPDEAILQAGNLGYPVVLKVMSKDIPHKTEVGGVAVGINDAEEMRQIFTQMMQRIKEEKPYAKIDGFLVQEMVQQGVEIIVGATNRPPFGPVVTVGLGGVWVELLKDVTYRQAPFGPGEAMNMLKELEGFQLLQGFRGSQPVNLNSLSELISRFSSLVVSSPNIEEIEMNPLILTDQGPKIADALCIPFKSANHNVEKI